MNEAAVEEGGGKNMVLPGFRFHPTDEELVGFYLHRKVHNKAALVDIIKEMDIYKYDPWDLSKMSAVDGVAEKEWYFFCLRGMKYRNSVRPNRVTGSGFWKATGIDKRILGPGSGRTKAGEQYCCIGLKKSLVYYVGRAGKGRKTDWMMHEFRLPPHRPTTETTSSGSTGEEDNWTICRIFKRNSASAVRSQQVWGSYDRPSTTESSSPNHSCTTESAEMNCQPQYSATQVVQQGRDDCSASTGFSDGGSGGGWLGEEHVSVRGGGEEWDAGGAVLLEEDLMFLNGCWGEFPQGPNWEDEIFLFY